MKVDRVVIQHLNKVLGQYLISINQYFLHGRILKNWGFESYGKTIYKKSIEDMKESDELIERILLLEGLPNLQDLGKILIGEDVPEIIKSDLQCEYSKRTSLVEAIAICEEKEDFVSRDLLEGLLEESEEHIDYLETQEELLSDLGSKNYHQSII